MNGQFQGHWWISWLTTVFSSVWLQQIPGSFCSQLKKQNFLERESDELGIDVRALFCELRLVPKAIRRPGSGHESPQAGRGSETSTDCFELGSSPDWVHILPEKWGQVRSCRPLSSKKENHVYCVDAGMGWTVTPNLYVEIPTPSASECGLTCEWGLCRANQVNSEILNRMSPNPISFMSL